MSKDLHQKIIALLKKTGYINKKSSDTTFSPECVRAWQTYCYSKGGKFAMYATRFPTEEILPLEVKSEIDKLLGEDHPKKETSVVVNKKTVETKETEKAEKPAESGAETKHVAVEAEVTAEDTVTEEKLAVEEKTGFFSKKKKKK